MGERLPKRPLRLAVVISHPIQHFVPLFVRLAQQADFELRVFYCCDWGVKEYHDPGFGASFAWDIPMLEGYEHEFLPIARRPETLTFSQVDNPDVGKRLEAWQPDAVWVHGYGHKTSWRVMRWARGRAAILYFGDSELLSARSLKARILKRLVLPHFFARCDGFMTIGDQNEAYYRHYGVPAEKFYRGSFPIDSARFTQCIVALTQDDRARLRAEFGLLPDAHVVLFVGKLIDIKRPLDLVEAIARISSENVQACFIGSGPLESVVRERVAALGLEQRVVFTGFVNQSRMPEVLWLGDMLAMCSEKDPHPLAVSEAMAVGNVIVASDRIGCVGPTDAARSDENAIVYPCGDIEALTSCIEQLVAQPKKLAQMSQRSVELSRTQDVGMAAAAVSQFMKDVARG